jgi:hypothetical protein
MNAILPNDPADSLAPLGRVRRLTSTPVPAKPLNRPLP